MPHTEPSDKAHQRNKQHEPSGWQMSFTPRHQHTCPRRNKQHSTSPNASWHGVRCSAGFYANRIVCTSAHSKNKRAPASVMQTARARRRINNAKYATAQTCHRFCATASGQACRTSHVFAACRRPTRDREPANARIKRAEHPQICPTEETVRYGAGGIKCMSDGNYHDPSGCSPFCCCCCNTRPGT